MKTPISLLKIKLIITLTYFLKEIRNMLNENILNIKNSSEVRFDNDNSSRAKVLNL